MTGLISGTDPDNPYGWGKLTDEHQAFVEMSPIALGLLLVPEKIWNPLTTEQKQALNEWLLQINDHKLPVNNWYFFRVLVNLSLSKVGGSYDAAQMEQDLMVIETFYLGDGWYSDGKTMQRDYYISFAFHFYSLLYAVVMEAEDNLRCQRMKERARLFAADFIYWFAEDGSALPYGRSLTYRFAQCGFWCALAFAGVEVFSWGVMKGIVCRHFRYWFQKEITDSRGVLTIGYGYPDLNMAEGYNAPGSPYWAFKSFLVLALSDSHPFWQAEELPLPALEAVRPMKHAGMIVTRSLDGHLTALTAGQYPGFEPVHSGEKYAKFAYSSRYAFHVPRSYIKLNQAAPDNMLSFWRDGMCFVRRICSQVVMEGNRLTSNWSPFAGAQVETVLEPCDFGHKRTHRIELDFDCEAVECGFGIPIDSYQNRISQCSETKALVVAEADYSLIRILQGRGETGEFLAETNTNLLYPRTLIPCVTFRFTKGVHIIELYIEAGSNGGKKHDE